VRVLLAPLALGLIVSVAAPAAAQRRADRDPQVPPRYKLGPDSLPQDGVPKGKLDGPHLFRSRVIPNTTRKYWVYVPARYTADKPACVLVFHDGARAVNPDGVLRVPQVLDNLIAKNQIPVTVGVFVTPGQRGDTYPDAIGTGNPDNRDREYDVLTDAYARMLVEELLPEVGKRYNLAKGPESRAIGGSSSGGICAFTAAWDRPDQFRNVVSLIGSFTNIHGGHVYPDLVRKADRKPIRVFLQDGELDNRSPRDPDRDWYLQNLKMIAALKEKGYDHAAVIGKGGHSDDHGGAILPYMLRWVWRDHPDVVKPTEDLVAAAAAVEPVPVDPFPGFDPKAAADPTGTYTWETRARGGVTVNTLAVQMADGTVTGTLETKRGDAPATSVPIADAVMRGNKLLFAAPVRVRDQETTLTYQGVVSDKGISGWLLADAGGRPRDTAWTARRVATK
jgi:enterochelin esterase family protein